MNKIIILTVSIFLMAGLLMSQSISKKIPNSIVCNIYKPQEISIKQSSAIMGVSSISIGASSYDDHLAFFFKNLNDENAGMYVIIFDYIDGSHSHQFKVMDIDKDGNDELGVWYMQGNHGHYMKVYEINPPYGFDKPKAWDIVFAADSFDPEIKDDIIICASSLLSDENIRIKKYKIKKGGAYLIEDKKISKKEFNKLKDKS